MDPAFDSAAFALPLNTVSQPVLSQFGFHLIEMTSRKGDKAKGRHILIPDRGGRRAPRPARRPGRQSREARRRARRIRRRSTPWPARSSSRSARRGRSRKAPRSRSGNLVVPDAGVWAFEAKPGADQPGDRDLDRVLHLPARQPPAGGRPAARADPRRSVAYQARTEKKVERGRAAGPGLPEARSRRAARMAGRGRLDEAAAQGIRPVLAGSTRRSTIPSWWARRSGWTWASGAACSTPRTGIYVIKVLEHTKADSAAFVKDLDTYRAQMINLARQDRVRSYLEALRQAAKVVDDRKKVLQQAGPATQARSAAGRQAVADERTRRGHALSACPLRFARVARRLGAASPYCDSRFGSPAVRVGLRGGAARPAGGAAGCAARRPSP